MSDYLFIDTAEGTRALLGYGGKTYYDCNEVNAGSETLLPMIDGLLKRAGITLGDLDILGACIGPGSFTGLRIGLTTVKTFCYALDKPCFAVNNLRLNSYNNTNGKVISLADAGNRICYAAVYDGQKEIEPPHCVTREKAAEMIAAYSDFSVSTDNRSASVFANATAGVGEREMVLAVKKHIKHAIKESELLPLYVRKPQPERGAGDL